MAALQVAECGILREVSYLSKPTIVKLYSISVRLMKYDCRTLLE
jgi:hypothetical protein